MKKATDEFDIWVERWGSDESHGKESHGALRAE
jgi:hypothetical protein